MKKMDVPLGVISVFVSKYGIIRMYVKSMQIYVRYTPVVSYSYVCQVKCVRTQAQREGFDVVFPFHSACVLLQSPFFLRSPPPTPRWRSAGGFLQWFALSQRLRFTSITFVHVFPGFIAQPFRGVAVGFEESHLRLMFQLLLQWNRDFSEFPIFLHVRLVR